MRDECPGRDELFAFVAGGECEAWVRAHIAGCRACRQEVERARNTLEFAALLADESNESATASPVPSGAMDRLSRDVTAAWEEGHRPAAGPRMRTLAVMFTDMAGSTEYAEKHGGRAAYAKRQEHNRLLLPLVEEHRGTLVQVIGDALLVTFGDVPDAARCAVAMQRRLAQYNASPELDVEDQEIHVRVGIHYGKVVVVREAGRIEIAGRAVNVAARVESGAGKQTDQILLSEAAAARLPTATFPIEWVGAVEAKGVGLLPLHLLYWREGEVASAAERPLALAAATGNGPGPQAEQDEARRAIHAVLLDTRTSRGYVLPVWAQVTSGGQAGVRARGKCDRVMQAAAKRAVKEVSEVLTRLGFDDARLDQQAVEWWVEGPDVRYEGASLGLAVALAAAGAHTGAEVDPGVAVTGAVHGGQVVPVAGVGGKWEALRASGRFHTLVLPTDNLGELPAAARTDPKLRVIGVPTVEAAVLDVLGPTLGLAAGRLAGISGRPPAGPTAPEVELWVQPEERQAVTRNIGLVPSDDVHSWRVGDRVRVCARADRDCHLAVVNLGTTGKVTILIPNAFHPYTAVRAGEVITFPGPGDRFHFELLGPPGRERLLAVASDRPLRLCPEDFDQSAQVFCAVPTTRNIGIVVDDIAPDVLGRCEIGFYVSARDVPESPPTSPRVAGKPLVAPASPFRPLDLG